MPLANPRKASDTAVELGRGLQTARARREKKKFQDLLSGPWFRRDVENEVDFDERHDVLVKMSRASFF